MDGAPPVLVVPGWGGSGPDHWQSAWQHQLGAACVELVDWLDPRPEVWLDALDRALVQLARVDSRPPVLVAHSLGCIVTAHRACRSHLAVRAALLVAPADVVHAPSLESLRAFGPVPTRSLPFRSLVVASDDDPHASLERAEAFASGWGSDLSVVRRGGHLNAASGLGDWPEGRTLLASLLRRTTPSNIS